MRTPVLPLLGLAAAVVILVMAKGCLPGIVP
jgi:hypothetical protein